MLGKAGFMSGLKNDMLEPMIDLVKEVEPGYSGIFAISEIEAAMRETRTKKTKTVCTFCGVGCTFEVWTKGRKILFFFFFFLKSNLLMKHPSMRYPHVSREIRLGLRKFGRTFDKAP